MRLYLFCALLILTVVACRTFCMPLFDAYDFFESPLAATKGRTMKSERTLDENGNPIKKPNVKKTQSSTGQNEKCQKNPRPETTTENCDDPTTPKAGQQINNQTTTTENCDSVEGSTKTTTENCDADNEPTKATTENCDADGEGPKITTENCDADGEAPKTTTENCDSDNGPTKTTTENCDNDNDPQQTTTTTANTCDDKPETTTESCDEDTTTAASKCKQITNYNYPDSPIVLNYKESYDRIINDLRENWVSPIDYLIQRGYLPKNAAKEIEKMKEKLTQDNADTHESSVNFDASDDDIYSSSSSNNKYKVTHIPGSAYDKMKAALAEQLKLDTVSHEYKAAISDDQLKHIMNNLTKQMLQGSDAVVPNAKSSDVEDFEKLYNLGAKTQKTRELNFKYANRHGSNYRKHKKLQKQMESAVNEFYDREFNKMVIRNNNKIKKTSRTPPLKRVGLKAYVDAARRIDPIQQARIAEEGVRAFQKMLNEEESDYQESGVDTCEQSERIDVPPNFDIHRAIEILKTMR